MTDFPKLVDQFGDFLRGWPFDLWLLLAIVILCFTAYALLRPDTRAERRAASEMVPCPFCQGPPVIITTKFGHGVVLDCDLGPDGCDATAYVFCHECGAHGPSVDGIVTTRAHIVALEQLAILNWNRRDGRHRELFIAGQRQGLNRYPRSA